jgi:hypothetical protein
MVSAPDPPAAALGLAALTHRLELPEDQQLSGAEAEGASCGGCGRLPRCRPWPTARHLCWRLALHTGCARPSGRWRCHLTFRLAGTEIGQ